MLNKFLGESDVAGLRGNILRTSELRHKSPISECDANKLHYPEELQKHFILTAMQHLEHRISNMTLMLFSSIYLCVSNTYAGN